MNCASEFIWRQPTNAGMWPEGVVKSLNTGENGVLGLCSCIKAGKMYHLAFKTAEEILDNGIVVGVALNGRNLSFQKNPAQ